MWKMLTVKRNEENTLFMECNRKDVQNRKD